MTVQLLPESPAHEPFLRELILRAIGDELGAWSWPEPLRASLLDQQYALRRNASRIAAPGRSSRIVYVDGAPAGWVCLADLAGEVRIVDIVVAPAQRRKGVGAAVVDSIASEAGDRPLRLNVTAANSAATAFYRRLGFQQTGGDGVQHFLERRRT